MLFEERGFGFGNIIGLELMFKICFIPRICYIYILMQILGFIWWSLGPLHLVILGLNESDMYIILLVCSPYVVFYSNL